MLDQGASVVETYKESALPRYLGCKADRPLTTYWAQQGMVMISELRDGNVPADYGNLRQVQEALVVLPEGVVKAYYRGDTVSYQRDLLRTALRERTSGLG